MSKSVRSSRRVERPVFRRKRRIPVGVVLRQVLEILLLLAGGTGIVVLLQRLPDQVDLMLLVSQAISNLISSIQLLLEAVVGLGGRLAGAPGLVPRPSSILHRVSSMS